MVNRRGCLDSSRLALHACEVQMLVEDLTCQMLREHIRRVIVACNLEELKISGSDPVMYPQLARGQVAHRRTLPMPVRLQIPIAADESVKTFSAEVHPKSAARLRKPRPSVEPFTIPVSSASAELNVTTRWVELQCLTMWLPRKAHPPEVISRVVPQPAKSVSTYTDSVLSSCHKYL